MIGTAPNFFRPGTEARRRAEAYGRLFGTLDVIVYTPRGFTAERLASGTRLHPTDSYLRILRPWDAFWLGRRIIRQQRMSVISVQDPAECGVVGLLLKTIFGLPLHIQFHTDVLSPYFRANSWKGRIRYWCALFIIPRGDYFRVVSKRIKRSLIARFRLPDARIVVLPIFVDRDKIVQASSSFDLRKKYPEFDFIVLMVSRLNLDKRIDVTLDVFVEFHKNYPKAGLVIVGDGPEEQNLKLKTCNLKLADNVRYEGWQRDLIPYYKGADLYLLTSAFEGYGRTVIEAASAGIPVVMTDVGVAGEVIRDGETGRVVPVGDRRALARALVAAYRDRPAMRAMAERARREVLALAPRTWEEYIERYRDQFLVIGS